MNKPLKQGSALRFVIRIGIISLFADFTYEGGRSIVGAYLATLGAGPIFVGLVAGLGDLLGYSVRWFSGRFVDRHGGHWKVMGAGYTLNLLSVPALALVPVPWAAGLLVFLERIGKGLRNPARDALLSRAGRDLGHGYAFGLHEVFDQVGAIIGPLVVAAVVAYSGYRLGFAVLIVPALAALFCLGRAQATEPERASVATPRRRVRFAASYYRYMAFAAITVLGFSHFILVAFHLQVTHRLTPPFIPVLFAVAMAADAVAAFVAGRLFDRYGLKVLYALPLLTVPTLPLLFLAAEPVWIGVGAALWGAALGVQESTMRAGVAVLTPESERGTAYGLFDMVFGVAWFVGSVMMGALYGLGAGWLVVVAVLLQIAALPLLRGLNRSRIPP